MPVANNRESAPAFSCFSSLVDGMAEFTASTNYQESKVPVVALPEITKIYTVVIESRNHWLLPVFGLGGIISISHGGCHAGG